MMRYVLAALVLFTSCAQFRIPGHVVDKPGLDEAAHVVWKSYNRPGPMPAVFIVEGDELTCASDVNGEPGFACPTVGCRQGCTGSPAAVHLVETLPWSQSVLAHEMWHVVEIRRTIATMLTIPATFEGVIGIGDRDHKGPAWQPGGEVDRANAALVQAGL